MASSDSTRDDESEELKKDRQMEKKRPTIEDIALLLRELTYVELKEFGDQLYRMSHEDGGDEIWDLTKSHEWAEMLDSWAEGNLPVEENT